MNARTRAPGQEPVRRPWLRLALVLLVAATGFGGFRAVALASATLVDPASLKLHGAELHVARVDEVVGLAAADLMGGMAHNVSGLVSDDQLMVAVTVSITAGGTDTTYDAKLLFARALGSPAVIRPAGGSLGSGRLSAHARVEGSVSFVVPRNGAHLVLGVQGSHRTIDLADVDRTAGSPHQHH